MSGSHPPPSGAGARELAGPASSGRARTSAGFDPLVPRPIDLPTAVPLDADVTTGEVADLLDDAKIFAAPRDPADWSRWREQLTAWRSGARERHGHTGAFYDRPGAAWASRCFTVAQVWLWDELFFDFGAQRFTPERFLADARERLGGLDAVVLWHAYPVIGIDQRNQWDYYRDVPHLAGVVESLQDAGVRVFLDYNPWDVGTRRGRDDVTELAAVIAELGADGVFLDTLKKAEPELVGALEAARPGIALEGESKLATERIADHGLSWAQWFADSDVPGVLRAHWYERRHMQHHVRRWNRDHAAELQSAWFNGVGVMVWEVVFGAWVGWNARDASTLRRMLPVQRLLADVLHTGEWTPLAPLAPEALAAGIYASSFSLDGVTLWTALNRSVVDAAVTVLAADAPGRWLDLHGGSELVRAADDPPEGLAVHVPAHGIAAVLHVAEGAAAPSGLEELRAELAAVEVSPDAAFPHRRAVRLRPASRPASRPAAASFPAASDRTTEREVLAADPSRSADAGSAATPRERRLRRDAVVVPAGEHVLTVRYRARETGMYDGAPYLQEWKPLPPRLHDQRTLERVAVLPTDVRVQASEVTNSEFDTFVQVTGYTPRTPHRYLALRANPEHASAGVSSHIPGYETTGLST